MAMKKKVLEVCVDSAESAIAAQEGGADGIELCANLTDDGTTPDLKLADIVRKKFMRRMNVMIRCRGEGFTASPAEFEQMKLDVRKFSTIGVDGVVLGLLKPDGSADIERTARLVEIASPMQVTFHRAFDRVPDPLDCLGKLIEVGITRLLTSGCAPTADRGTRLVRLLKHMFGDAIIVASAGRISHLNVTAVLRETGADEIHVAGSVSRADPESSSIPSRGPCTVDAELVSRMAGLIGH